MPLEAWLRGPVDRVPPILVPVAHMLQHAQDDAVEAVCDLTPDQIWVRPGGGASVGFHVRHLMGALDRLFTYARGDMLSAGQLNALKHEGDAGSPPASAATLTAELSVAIARAIDRAARDRSGDAARPARRGTPASAVDDSGIVGARRRALRATCGAGDHLEKSRAGCWVLGAGCGAECLVPGPWCGAPGAVRCGARCWERCRVPGARSLVRC